MQMIQWVKIGMKPFFIEKSKFWKTWLTKLGYHGNVNVDVHLNASFQVKSTPEVF